MINSWNEVKLGDVVNMQYGFTAKAEVNAVGPKYLRITDIVPPIINWEDVPYCRIDSKKKHVYKLKVGDTVVARIGATAGYAKLIRKDVDAIFASYLIRLTPKENDLDNRFLGLLLESRIFKEYVDKTKTGSAQPQANAPVLKDFEFKIPSLVEQKRISSVIESYNDLIVNNEKRIAGIFDLSLNMYLKTIAKIKTDQSVKKQVCSLGDFVQFKKGKNITRKSAFQGPVPVVAGGIEPAYFHNTPNTKGPVITVSASGANAGFVNLYHEDIWASDCSYIDSTMTPHLIFIYLFLKTNQSQITNLQKGSAQPHVYPKDLMRLEIVIPDKELLDEFTEKVNKLYGEIAVLKSLNSNLKATRDLLIETLISGKREIKK